MKLHTGSKSGFAIRAEDAISLRPFHPFCNTCGWRKGGVDSWTGTACKCGHSEPVIRPVPLTADEAAERMDNGRNTGGGKMKR